jgi:hypothetical protein
MKIRPVGAEPRMDGQTDMTKLTVVSCNSAKAPNKPGTKHKYWGRIKHSSETVPYTLRKYTSESSRFTEAIYMCTRLMFSTWR